MIQVATITALFVVFSVILVAVLRWFGQSLKIAGLLIVPLVFFSLGFGLRLSGNAEVINLGYFLTEFSGLFVSVLFTTFLFLGQLKYWKK